jgi:hypothetical protein
MTTDDLVVIRNDDCELVCGSGNIFADFGAPDVGLRQLHAVLAAEIVKALDADGLTVRDAARGPALLRRIFRASARPSSIGLPLSGCFVFLICSIGTSGWRFRSRRVRAI